MDFLTYHCNLITLSLCKNLQITSHESNLTAVTWHSWPLLSHYYPLMKMMVDGGLLFSIIPESVYCVRMTALWTLHFTCYPTHLHILAVCLCGRGQIQSPQFQCCLGLLALHIKSDTLSQIANDFECVYFSSLCNSTCPFNLWQ